MVKTQELKLHETHTGDIVDVTGGLAEAVKQSGINSGTITAFCPGSTGGMTTVEYEPGLQKDLPEFFEKIGFKRIDKSELPHKIWSDCIDCPHFPDCSEVALAISL